MAITLPNTLQQGGGVTQYYGTYSHTVGAANETFNLGAARVLDVRVSSQDSSSNLEAAKFSESVSGATNTVTIHRQGGVTSGRIVVTAYAGN